MAREPGEPIKRRPAPEPPPNGDPTGELLEAENLRLNIIKAYKLLQTQDDPDPQVVRSVAEELKGTPLSDDAGVWDDPREVKDMLLRSVFVSPFRINSMRSLTDEGSGKPFQLTTGDILVEEPNKKIVADWSDAFRTTHPKIVREISAALVAEMQKLHKHHNPCKVFLRERGGIVVINIDAGNHKESMAIVLTNDKSVKTIAVYNHVPSAHESRGPQAYRGKYIEGALKGISHSLHERRESKGHINALMSGQRKPLVSHLFRLALSVKDLDIVFSNDRQVICATRLFGMGVTNMDAVLSIASIDQEPVQLEHHQGHTITPLEHKILTDMFKQRHNMKEHLEHVRRSLESARIVRDINYSALETLDQLRAMAFEEIASRPGQMQRLFKRLALYIHEMRRSIPVPTPDVSEEDINTLVERFADAIDMLDHPPTEESVARYYQRAQQEARVTIRDMVDDTPEQLESWDQVQSLNQAIRFFHRKLYTIESRFGRTIEDLLRLRNQAADPLAPSPDRTLGVTVVDVRTEEQQKSELADGATQTLKSIQPLHDTRVTGRPDKPVMVIGNNYLEIRASAGKHLIELLAEQDQRETTVSFRLCESGYHGSSQRLAFARSVLKEMDFVEHTEQKQQGRWLQMHLKTESPERWRNGLATAIRMFHALPDLDLDRIAPEFIDLFGEGVTHLNILSRQFITLKQKTPEEIIADNERKQKISMKNLIESIIYFGDSMERRLLVEILDSKLSGPKAWQRVCVTIPPKEREKMVDTLLAMEHDTQAQKKFAATRRWRSRANALIDTL